MISWVTAKCRHCAKVTEQQVVVRKHADFSMRMSTRHYGNADTGAMEQGSIPEKRLLNKKKMSKGAASVKWASDSSFGQEQLLSRQSQRPSWCLGRSYAQGHGHSLLCCMGWQRRRQKGARQLAADPTGMGGHLTETLHPGVHVSSGCLLAESVASDIRGPQRLGHSSATGAEVPTLLLSEAPVLTTFSQGSSGYFLQLYLCFPSLFLPALVCIRKPLSLFPVSLSFPPIAILYCGTESCCFPFWPQPVSGNGQ